jgi:beta-glucosidase/6-phospho-beta-glucosidase/beta-galactosidase
MGFDGVRLSVEWARIEPRRDEIDDAALERYADVARYAQNLGLGVTLVIVDAAWPAWLGLEAWLLPWVVPRVLAHAKRVVNSIPVANGVVVFANPQALVDGFLDSSAPPWRRGARADAEMARAQIELIGAALRDEATVGPKIVASTRSVSVDQPLAQVRSALEGECDELYIRSLVRGHGPSASAGLLVKRSDGWRVEASPELLEFLR